MGRIDTEELREDLIRELMRKHLAAMRTNCLIGHKQTLGNIADELAHLLSAENETENLIRGALSCGPLKAGEMLLALINKALDVPAELAAIKEVERIERDHAGLDVKAMRLASAPATHFAVTAAFAAVAAAQAMRSPAPA